MLAALWLSMCRNLSRSGLYRDVRFQSSLWHLAGSLVQTEKLFSCAVQEGNFLRQLFDEAHSGSSRPVAYLKGARLE